MDIVIGSSSSGAYFLKKTTKNFNYLYFIRELIPTKKFFGYVEPIICSSSANFFVVKLKSIISLLSSNLKFYWNCHIWSVPHAQKFFSSESIPWWKVILWNFLRNWAPEELEPITMSVYIQKLSFHFVAHKFCIKWTSRTLWNCYCGL